VPGHHVNFVDPAGCPRIRLHLARQLHRQRFGDQPAAQLLRHGLHVRNGQDQLTRDLPVGKVQAHEVEAQHPHTQRLVMSGQHHSEAILRREMPRSGIKASEVVEAGRACFASVALMVRLRVVAPVPDHRGTVAARAAYAIRPAMLAHKREALGVVHQAGKVDQVGCRHDGGASSREPVGWSHSAITSDTCRLHHPDHHPRTRQEPYSQAEKPNFPDLCANCACCRTFPTDVNRRERDSEQ